MTDNEVILNALKGKIDTRYGICALVDIVIILYNGFDGIRINRLFKQMMIEQAEKLGFYSGNPTFPINGIDDVCSAEIFYNHNNMWNEEDEYCRRRIALHKALIQVFEERVEYEQLEQQNMDNLEGKY